MTTTMAPIRSTRSRLPTAFSSSANRVRKRPGSPMALPSPSRRSAFNPLNLLFGAYDRRQVHTPQNKRELFTRHVFPVSHAPYEPGPLFGFDIECATFEFQQLDPKLRVQYHAGLATVLFGQSSRIAEGPVGPSATAQSLAQYQLDLSDMTDIIMAELQAAVRRVDLDAAAARREGNTDFNLEQTICRAALYHLAVPINNFCEVSDDNFKDLSRSFLWTGWTWDPAEGRAATEWIGQFRGKTRAMCHWKLDLTEADMDALVAGARGEQQGGHALHPGFFMSAAGNHLDCTDDRVTVNGAKACALVSSVLPLALTLRRGRTCTAKIAAGT